MTNYVTEELLDKRIDEVLQTVKAGFDAVDDKFLKVDERFLLVDQRFESLEQKMDDLNARMSAGFDTLDAFVKLYTRHEQEISMNRFGLIRHEGRITALEKK